MSTCRLARRSADLISGRLVHHRNRRVALLRPLYPWDGGTSPGARLLVELRVDATSRLGFARGLKKIGVDIWVHGMEKTHTSA